MSKTKITKPKIRYILKLAVSVIGSIYMILYVGYKGYTLYENKTIHWINMWHSFLAICGICFIQIVLNSIVEVFTEKEI